MMRSQRAKAHLKMIATLAALTPEEEAVFIEACEMTISPLEADARERAIKAFCSAMCPAGPLGCPLNCDTKQDFLNHYDND